MKYSIAIMLLLHSFAAMAMTQQQKNDHETEQSSLMDTPRKKLSFTEAWVWAYEDISGARGELVVYREPQSGCWLFTPEAYGGTSEMTDWVIADRNGNYIFAYSDGEMNAHRKLHLVKAQFTNTRVLPKEWKSNGKQLSFGDTDLGFPAFRGSGYASTYLKTTEHSVFYISATSADLSAIYYFNQLNIDARLPFSFPQNIPGKQIVLSEQTQSANGISSYRFKHISHTTYQINLSDYEP